MAESIIVVKLGGTDGVDFSAICNDAVELLKQGKRLVFVHGGSAEANALGEGLGTPPKMITSPSGYTSRYTDRKTLEIFLMAVNGKVNSLLTEQLQTLGVNAFGLCGLDGRLLQAVRKESVQSVENGKRKIIRDDYTGKIEKVNNELLLMLLNAGYLPVIAPVAVSEKGEALTLLNSSIIVFREGLEAVVILAALLASMVGTRRAHRKPMAFGVILAFVASALTWWLAQTILTSFRAYGERLEAIVSLVAIGVLLLITNWFLHRVDWTDWMADLHKRKKAILGGAAGGQIFGFVMLGFTSVYREGFETVLFLQALVLEAGFWAVFYGVALGLVGVFAVGWLTFRLQSRLPYKRMLVVTGVLIGAVLLVMVGSTVHVMQVVGWLPIHPIRWMELPYWMGLWFGTYPTWEGLGLQGLAACFVVGSYFWAERVHKQRKPALASTLETAQNHPAQPEATSIHALKHG